jgi:atypical dual specificity phosphatase
MMKNRKFEVKVALPEFPRTPHLPFRATNLEEGDLVAKASSGSMVLAHDIFVEEKMDGTNIRTCLFDGHFYLGNRRDILRKGQLPKNPSGKQFKPFWNWLYDHKAQFEALNRLPPFGPEEPATIYGEWLWMAHGMIYDRLPDFFMAFDVYDSTEGQFLHPNRAKLLLEQSGFEMPRRLLDGTVKSYSELALLLDQPSAYASGEKQEGIYVKVPRTVKGRLEMHRFKMVREDFPRGKYFGPEMVRNGVVEPS